MRALVKKLFSPEESNDFWIRPAYLGVASTSWMRGCSDLHHQLLFQPTLRLTGLNTRPNNSMPVGVVGYTQLNCLVFIALLDNVVWPVHVDKDQWYIFCCESVMDIEMQKDGTATKNFGWVSPHFNAADPFWQRSHTLNEKRVVADL